VRAGVGCVYSFRVERKEGRMWAITATVVRLGIEWVMRQSGGISGHVTWFCAWIAMLDD
jgi:hypothetical protein